MKIKGHFLLSGVETVAHGVLPAGIGSLALPRLSTGVGGLDWKELESLITEHFKDFRLTVFLYDHCIKGLKAEE